MIAACTIGVGVMATAMPAPAWAANPNSPAALQAVVDRVVADGVPGVIALDRRGATLQRAVSGVRDLRTMAPIRAVDAFRVGSITKSFVSTVVLQLVGEGRLGLDDGVDRWLPGLIPNGAAITVRELLNHTSGLFDYLNDGDPTILVPYFVNRDWEFTWQPLQLIAVATSHPAWFPPGTQWRYSNTNYVVLGLIIEAVTHRDAASEIEQLLLRPLGLRHTSLPTTDPDLDSPHTNGYLTNLPPESGFPSTLDVTRFSPSYVWTAGAMVSTVDELARFHGALFTGRLLPPAQQSELETTVPTPIGVSYGLGVYELATPCGPAWGHDGDVFGFATVSLTSPDGSRQVVVSLNSDRILTTQAQVDLGDVLITGFCGQTVAPARSLPLVHALNAVSLPH
ncbi:MAG TPA: serine hydrolase domain-containing protein [Candidatus Dormibacteraeota bacterium]|nr:serine hydrolase domain-containing protein [Candidatus Dormibacteraeota bacterium]